jgi:hypothetical protein
VLVAAMCLFVVNRTKTGIRKEEEKGSLVKRTERQTTEYTERIVHDVLQDSGSAILNSIGGWLKLPVVDCLREMYSIHRCWSACSKSC